MNLMRELSRRHDIPVRIVGGLDLVSCADAPRFLDACEEAQVWVVGIEGFRFPQGRTEPDMNAIADFGELRDTPQRVDESIAAARGFINEVCSSDLMLDFVLEEFQSTGPEASDPPPAAQEAGTIHVALLDEDVDVWRPVKAEHIGGDVYRICEQPYDRDLERWEFEPGEEVVVESIATLDGTFLTAVRRRLRGGG